jgi:hypothetical protein
MNSHNPIVFPRMVAICTPKKSGDGGDPPSPVPTSKAKSPRRRLWPGGDVASAQVSCARYGERFPLMRARFLWSPAAMGGACGATPRLAAAGCVKACRLRCWRFVAYKSRRAVHRHTCQASLMELPSYVTGTGPQAAAFPPCRRGVGLVRIRVETDEAVTRDVESAMSPFGSGRPVRPWFVVNPGEGTAAPWASWPQPSSANNFPAAARLPRGTNSLRFQVLHVVATAARCDQPIPRRPDHNKDALARPRSTQKEKHHG